MTLDAIFLLSGLGLFERFRKVSHRDRRRHDGQGQERPARASPVALPEVPSPGRLRAHPDRGTGSKHLPHQQLHRNAPVRSPNRLEIVFYSFLQKKKDIIRRLESF